MCPQASALQAEVDALQSSLATLRSLRDAWRETDGHVQHKWQALHGLHERGNQLHALLLRLLADNVVLPQRWMDEGERNQVTSRTLSPRMMVHCL